MGYKKEKKHKKHKKVTVKHKLHARNQHRDRYDFAKLVVSHPELKSFVKPNVHGDESVDFFDPEAVRHLNTALLKHYYNIENWDIPEGYLCPPIPGRADYIHHISDILGASNYGNAPTGQKIRCLDVGVGANCIYPIIGTQEYNWSFVGTEIDTVAFDSATRIVETNPQLSEKVELRLQTNPKDIFYGVLRLEEKFDLTICNPPFHSSEKEAREQAGRKVSNLKGKEIDKPVLNFGGKSNELWCDGGEVRFLREMIRESKRFGENVFWFSTLVSKQTHLKGAYESLKMVAAKEVKTIPMGQGNKSSRILAWTFFDTEQKQAWQKSLASS